MCRPMYALMVLLGGGVAAEPGVASVVYSQPPQQPLSDLSVPFPDGNWTTDSATDGGFRVYDDFRLSGENDLRMVTWRGYYFDIQDLENNPAVVPDTTSWELSFWSDDAGRPDRNLYRETISAADVGMLLVGTGDFAGIDVSVFDLEATLSTPFNAEAHTTYWLSVLSISESLNPVFAWAQGIGPDGLSFMENLDSGSGTVRGGDRAMSLATIMNAPEPWALAVWFVLGLVGIVAVRFCRGFAQ